MAEKVTTMLIKVNLRCYRCYKKIRRVLCSFPEIRDQIYDEKQNTVKITVVSCCPGRIQKKICSRGGESVEKIEIISGDKKKEPEKKKEGPEKAKDGAGEKDKGEKKKESADKAREGAGEKKKDEPNEKGKEGEPKDAEKKTAAQEPETKKDGENKPEHREPEKKPKEAVTMPIPAPVAGYPSIFPPVYPVQAYYDPYLQHQVHVGGPRPVPYHQCHGMPDYYGPCDGNRGTYYGYQYDHFSEENPPSCTVM